MVTELERETLNALPTNPEFNKAFLDKFVHNFLPTCVLWSGMLLGDLSRYTSHNVKSYVEHKTEISVIPRTNIYH